MTNKKITLSREVGEMILRNRDRLGSGIIDPIRAALDEPVPMCNTSTGARCPGDGVNECKKCPGEPVPPAGGDAESVIRQYRVVRPDPRDTPYSAWFEIESAEKDDQISASLRFTEGRGDPAVYEVRELVDRAHVTRLQAEVRQLRQHKNDYMEAAEETRKALQAEAVERNAWAHEASARIDQLEDEGDALQSELTKAREFLSKANIHVPVNYPLKKEIIAFLSNQSAPADKEGQSWTV